MYSLVLCCGQNCRASHNLTKCACSIIGNETTLLGVTTCEY